MFADDDLADLPWAVASLRVASETLGIEDIDEHLGFRHTTARLAEGEPSFTVWMLESGLEPASPIEDHLYLLVERLRDRADAVAKLCESANVEIWLSFSPRVRQEASVLDHALLAELVQLGVDLVLEPYPPAARRPSRSPGG